VLVAGNWKMFKGSHQAREFAAQIRRVPGHAAGVDVVVCPPFVSLEATLQGLGADSGVQVYAQNVHWELEGAFTGEVSAPMLLELGVTGAIVGHSERRQYFCDTDAVVAAKAKAALAAGIVPIVCVGETAAERDAGTTERVVLRQLDAVLEAVGADAARMVVAYEPVWAIGTGRTATPEQAQAVHATLRARLTRAGAGNIAVLYGGSVKADNAQALFGMADIDGGLIGGASLKAGEFLAIARA
jgi:triosephosphate isomerase (TIM)